MKSTKKLTTFLLTLAMILALVPVMPATAVTSPSLLILGDSIATGYGLTDPGTESYGALLAAKLGASDGKYQNLAVDGATSGDLMTAFSNPAFLAEVATANIIVISIGGNDVLGPFLTLAKTTLGLQAEATNTELQYALLQPGAIDTVAAAMANPMTALTFASYASNFANTNLPAIVGGIKTANPDAMLYIQTIYNPFDGVPGMESLAETANLLFSNMNGAIKAGATLGGYTTVDVSAEFSGKALLYTNITQMDIHPNAAGHGVIFSTILAHIPFTDTFTVTFNGNGGTVAGNEILTRTVSDGNAVGELPTATRDGYSLSGWFTETDGGVQISESFIINNNITFYAGWTADSMPESQPKQTTQQTSTPKYTITELGANGTWAKGSPYGLTIISNGDFDKFVELKMNGATIDTNHYTKESGSTKITLKPEYLETLTTGTYTVEIVFSDGTAQASFTILALTSPKTGDRDRVMLWLCIMAVSVSGLGTAWFMARRRKN